MSGGRTQLRACSNGFAIVAVMWMLAALALLVSGLMTAARTEIRSLQGVQDMAQVAAVGDAAIQIVLQALQASGERPTRATQLDVAFDASVVTVRVMPAEGFVDVNTADKGLLAQLFEFAGGIEPGMAEKLAESVEAWRSPGSVESAGGSQRHKRQRFDAIEDLLQVPGFDFGLFDRIRDLITTASGTAGVDPLAAPPEVLFVLASGNRDAAARISTLRDSGDPVIDMTSLTHAQPNSAGGSEYRLDAIVAHGAGRALVRSAWASLAGEADGIPWQIFEIMPVRAITMGAADGQ